MKKFLSIFIIAILLLFSSCSTADGTMRALTNISKGADGLILTADYSAGNEWYCVSSDESVATAEIFVTDGTMYEESSDFALLFTPVSKGSSEVTAIYSATSGDLFEATAMYQFTVEVSEDLTVSFNEIIPEPSIALGITKDETFWEFVECDENIHILEYVPISMHSSDTLTYYFPVVALSAGECRASFTLKDSDNTPIQNVTYNITVSDDLSISFGETYSELV